MGRRTGMESPSLSLSCRSESTNAKRGMSRRVLLTTSAWSSARLPAGRPHGGPPHTQIAGPPPRCPAGPSGRLQGSP
eukprot:9301538-Pyramimonas_sp.AAC.1